MTIFVHAQTMFKKMRPREIVKFFPADTTGDAFFVDGFSGVHDKFVMFFPFILPTGEIPSGIEESVDDGIDGFFFAATLGHDLEQDIVADERLYGE